MSHGHLYPLPERPERLSLSGAVQGLAAAGVVAGAAALGFAFSQGQTSLAWSSYLIGVFFALGLGLFGVAWLAILHLSGGTWSITMRRVPEAMTAWLVPGGVLALLVVLGVPALYHWADAEAVAGDALLTHKSPFLNVTMFTAFTVASVAVWTLFASIIVGASRRQDADGSVAASRTARTASGAFLVVFALTLSVVAFYFLLSLDAHWFSTMFAVLVFTDVMQTGVAYVTLAVCLLVAAGALKGFVNEHHLHSLGKMLFAWTGFWAYIYFCQFMLIWYANIPEETVYFMKRTGDGWLPYLLALPLLKFVVPFLAMIPRGAKRAPARLVPLAILILVAQFLELYVMVGPAVGHDGAVAPAHLPLVEFAATLGFLGLFTLVFGWALARHDAVPLRDPGLRECLEYQS